MSVVVADTGRDSALVRRTVSSMTGQTNLNWELVVAGNGSPVPAGWGQRISTVAFTGSRAEGWAAGLEQSRGLYTMVLDAGSMLAPQSVEIISTELGRHGLNQALADGTSSPAAKLLPELLYGDEDVIDAAGRRDHGFYKPSFSPDRLRVQDYLGEAVVYRRDVVDQVGGLNPEHGFWARYDLTLRMVERAESVVHIAAIIVHQFDEGAADEAPSVPTGAPPSDVASSNDSSDAALESGMAKVVQGHLDRTRFPAKAVGEQAVPGSCGRRQSTVARLGARLTEHPKVSVIIPTGGSSRVVRGRRQRLIDLALTSLTANTSYTNYEVVVVFDRHSSEELQSSVAQQLTDCSHSLVQDHRTFNYSQACNLGVARSTGDILVFLNDDTEIIQGDWMDRLVMFATRPQTGAVGVKLLYEDGRLQHTGVWARDGHVAHRYAGFSADHPGVRGSLLVQQNCSAVTGACLAIERTKFEHVGGFCTALPLAFNDVDLCFKLQMAGYRSLIDGDNIVVHLESSSRNPSTHQWELDHLHHRWRPVMYFDPYDNPNNSGRDCDEYPPTPPEMADARWEQRQFQRNGRVWQRSPIVVDDLGGAADPARASSDVVELGTGSPAVIKAGGR